MRTSVEMRIKELGTEIRIRKLGMRTRIVMIGMRLLLYLLFSTFWVSDILGRFKAS